MGEKFKPEFCNETQMNTDKMDISTIERFHRKSDTMSKTNSLKNQCKSV